MWVDLMVFGVAYLILLSLIVATLYVSAWAVLKAECRAHHISTRGKGVISMAIELTNVLDEEKRRRNDCT